MEDINTRILEYIDKTNMPIRGRNVIVGLSGGADSVCLLLVLDNLKKILDINITAVTVHHGIRKSADNDILYCRSLCEELGVLLREKYIDCIAIAEEKRISVEEAGRNERYAYFNEVCNEVGNACIAVAHHKNDCAETVIFNMLRGSNLSGLSGIRPQRDRIVRPLLELTREEIVDYLNSIGRTYMTDETNADTDYSRNMIRCEIIPRMEAINKRAVQHIVRLAENAACNEDYLSYETNVAYEKYVTADNYGIYIADDYYILHPVIAKRVLYKALCTLSGRARDISDVHVSAIYELSNNNVGKHLDLIYNICARKDYDRTILSIKKADNQDNKKQDMNVNIELADYTPDMGFPNNKYTKWIDCDKISNCLTIRNRMPGDYIIINEAGDRKSLKEYFINEKIPSGLRDTIPLVADGNLIVWVVGYRISANVKISGSTERIAKLTYGGCASEQYIERREGNV